MYFTHGKFEIEYIFDLINLIEMGNLEKNNA